MSTGFISAGSTVNIWISSAENNVGIGYLNARFEDTLIPEGNGDLRFTILPGTQVINDYNTWLILR